MTETRKDKKLRRTIGTKIAKETAISSRTFAEKIDQRNQRNKEYEIEKSITA